MFFCDLSKQRRRGNMLSRHQKRILRYVEEGSLLKLKSYLRKHAEVGPNFSAGRRKRSPLHLACRRGDDAVLRLLLKHGADPLRTDRRGDTPLHLAAERARRRGRSAYEDLVVPLCDYCPGAMEVTNHAGVTPRSILQRLRLPQGPSAAGEDSPFETDAEREWREKLLGECQDEFTETFGRYDDDFLLNNEDTEEDFVDWAERIRQQYVAKQRARAQREAAASTSGRKRKDKTEKEAQSHREVLSRLEQEHRQYLERAARKEQEIRLVKRRRYEERYTATFHGNDVATATEQAKLGYADIPWPVPRGTVEEMVEVMLYGINRNDAPNFRKLLRQQQAIWHPDKFTQRCGDRLDDKEKQIIMDTVTALSQELNRLAQNLR
ncbi:NF-kappa-B inhibitor-like protein 1 [Denticeps clupeoides]|uniref:NF-kappa-B inhibitor-like protein 1 n=1 Tax=Denticeps clupeoides TaxID=299321 RepID=UPI0010A36837|nr:NF-kappa-B inhibitor-like protein 1 [Denticeps clupeoides]